MRKIRIIKSFDICLALPYKWTCWSIKSIWKWILLLLWWMFGDWNKWQERKERKQDFFGSSKTDREILKYLHQMAMSTYKSCDNLKIFI